MTFRDDFIKGTCTSMCPGEEFKMREREGLLHPLEMQKGSENTRYSKADPRRMVKKFSRCAAGQRMPKPSDLRSPQALKNTVAYLLKEVICVEKYNWNVVYDFVFDRLCAVRQDVVIQGLDVGDSIEIMKPIVRFLAYSGYRMCEESIQNYDPAINYNHFTECLRKLIKLYDIYEQQNECSDTCHCERSQFEALYLITFLGEPEAIYRGLNLKSELMTTTVAMSLQMSIARFGGNYIRVCKMMKDLSALLLCVVALHLPTIRRKAINVMNSAFSSRNLYYPASCLKSELLYENEAKVIDECEYYGIKIEDGNIFFQKGSFKENIPMMSACRQHFIDDILRTWNLPDLMYEYDHYC